MEDRLERAFGAKTYGELNELVADLPQGRPLPAGLDAGNDPDTLVLDTTTATNTANIRNKATGPVDPSAPTVNVIGHPRIGYIRIKQPR